MTAFGKAEGSPVAAAINAAWMLGVCWITCHTVACQWVTRFCFTTVSPHNCLNVWLWKLHKCRFWWVFPTWDSIVVKNRLFKATLALADAGIPMRDLVVACTAGMWPGEANNQRKQQANNRMEFADFSAHFGKIRIHPCSMKLDDCLSVAFFWWQGFFQKFCRTVDPLCTQDLYLNNLWGIGCCYYFLINFSAWTYVSLAPLGTFSQT